VNFYSDNGTDTVTLHLDEAAKEVKINCSPGGTIRYSQYKIGLDMYAGGGRDRIRCIDQPVVAL